MRSRRCFFFFFLNIPKPHKNLKTLETDLLTAIPGRNRDRTSSDTKIVTPVFQN